MAGVEIQWSAAPADRQLTGSDVHVWATGLDTPADRIESLLAILSPDERQRADRFVFARDRNRFICGRAMLRTILASYLSRQAKDLRFDYGPNGKPALADKPVYFNAAHSDDLMLVAVTRACPIGVDVERIRSLAEAGEIANRFFTAGETARLAAVPKHQHDLSFFRLWTRKEACLKARGQGIAEMLDQIEVSFIPDEPARLIAISGNARAAEQWTLEELAPAPQFTAALAAPMKGLKLTCWHWLQ